jgi:hypothetical protein
MFLSTANLCFFRLPIYVSFDCQSMFLSTAYLCFFRLLIYVSFDCLSMFLSTVDLRFFQLPIYVSSDCLSMFLSTAYLCFFLLKQKCTSKNIDSYFSIENRNFNTGPNSAGLRPYKVVRDALRRDTEQYAALLDVRLIRS